MNIILVAGHHRRSIFRPFQRPDPGATPKYPKQTLIPPVYSEHEEAEKLVRGAYRILHHEGRSVHIVPYYLNLISKIKYINKHFSSSDFLFSIHLNGSSNPKSSGCEIWYYGGSPIAQRLARKASTVLSDTLQIRKRGNGAYPDTKNRYGQLGIIRNTTPFAFLLECGFVTNPDDVRNARKYGYQAIADTIKAIIN